MGGEVSSTLSLTSALDVDGWSTPRPGRFTPGKHWHKRFLSGNGRTVKRGSLYKTGPTAFASTTSSTRHSTVNSDQQGTHQYQLQAF